MEFKNISHIKDCYGCGVCAIICPKKIIKIDLNKDGFYEPILFNEEVCTQCGLCLSVCAYNDDKLLDNKKEIKGYAAWSNNEKVRRKCTSGGIGFELGKHMIKEGYKACGVKYNPELNCAEHFIASTIEEFIPSIGSKYIQSYTLTGFSQLNRKNKFFVTGTPCQIDSLRRYIRKLKIEENFVLMDFFCHGVPSMNMWKKYTEMVEQKTGEITHASWRNKQTGWHDSWAMGLDGSTEGKKIDWHESTGMSIRGGENVEYFSLMSKGDLFYKFFLGNSCLGKACYDNDKCKYKMTASAADIRIGDLWGNKYKDNKEGVSALLVLTYKGKEVISQLEGCTLKEEDISVVTEGQMKVSPKKPIIYSQVLRMLRNKNNLLYIYKKIKIVEKLLNIHKILFYKYLRVVNKNGYK